MLTFLISRAAARQAACALLCFAGIVQFAPAGDGPKEKSAPPGAVKTPQEQEEIKGRRMRALVVLHDVPALEAEVIAAKPAEPVSDATEYQRIAVKLAAWSQQAVNDGNFDTAGKLARRAEFYAKKVDELIPVENKERKFALLEFRLNLAENFTADTGLAHELRAQRERQRAATPDKQP